MLYAPVLRNTQTAFVAESANSSSITEAYNIEFSLQGMTDPSTIKVFQIRIAYQNDNSHTIGDAPDGTIYYNVGSGTLQGEGPFSIPVLIQNDIEKWKPGQLYRIQLRYGTSSYPGEDNFAAWKHDLINSNSPDWGFSEWSTVMIVKAIDPIVPEILNDKYKIASATTETNEITLTPLFQGSANTGTEILEKFRFDLYDGRLDSPDDEKSVESSGWISHVPETVDKHRFLTVLQSDMPYTVFYSIQTKNGYGVTSAPYRFKAQEVGFTRLDMDIMVDSDSDFARENGCMSIYCTESREPLNGCYVIVRTSEATNFEIWEDVKYLAFNETSNITQKTLLYRDYTIESGVRYKYGIVRENAAGIRSSTLKEDSLRIINFEHHYLYRDGIQLKLSLDSKMSSFKHTTQRSKQDVLGGSYPLLVQNGDAYYAEFPITGLISFYMDNDETFFTYHANSGDDDSKPSGYYYKDESMPVIPSYKFHVGRVNRKSDASLENFYIDRNLIEDNIFVERKFREKVEEFLNDFSPKLYKSATEGNNIVGLTNVSLTPNEQLGRMIYSFSATAYQILDTTLQNLDEYGVAPIGSYIPPSDLPDVYSFGQITGAFTPPRGNIAVKPGDKRTKSYNTDIFATVKEKEEVPIEGTENEYKVKYITSFWIERCDNNDDSYLLVKLSQDRKDLSTEQAKNPEDWDWDKITELEEEITYYEDWLFALKNYSENALIKVKINNSNNEVVIAPGRIYALNDDQRITDLVITSAVYPVNINYTVRKAIEINNKKVVAATSVMRLWGQLAGAFTNTDNVIKVYNYNSKPYNPNDKKDIAKLEVPDMIKLRPLTQEEINQGYSPIKTIRDKKLYNVYRTLDILATIKEDALRCAAANCSACRFEVNKEDPTGKDYVSVGRDGKLGKYHYLFDSLTKLDIETEPGVPIYITKKEDSDSESSGGETVQVIRVGPTGRYILKDIDLTKIELVYPQFCIVNYTALGTLNIMRE